MKKFISFCISILLLTFPIFSIIKPMLLVKYPNMDIIEMSIISIFLSIGINLIIGTVILVPDEEKNYKCITKFGIWVSIIILITSNNIFLPP
jgi:transcriptional antiterminator